MDMVYQRASFSLGLLDAVIGQQRHIDALEVMYEAEGVNEPQLKDLAEVLELIAADRWFTRAWVLQESTCGGAQIELLIRCNPQLAKSPYHSYFDAGSVELRLTEMADVLSAWLPNVLDDMAGAIDESLGRRLTAIVELWFSMMPPQATTDFDPDERAACNAAEALHFLGKRQNSIIADRLAILANLCDYKTRLTQPASTKQGTVSVSAPLY